MRYCTNCSKQLARTTKGDLCITCYRNRNNDVQVPVEPIVLTNDLESSDIPTINGNNSVDCAESVESYIIQDDIKDDRAIINVLKKSMLTEKLCNDEIITMQRDQITFLKQEISHKNKVINDLITALNDKNNHSAEVYDLKSKQ